MKQTGECRLQNAECRMQIVFCGVRLHLIHWLRTACHLLLLAVCLLPDTALAGRKVYVAVDGGYSPGRGESDMDKLIDRRLRKALDIEKARDASADTHKFDTKQQLEDLLKGLKLKCGDTLKLFMMGHGQVKEFRFTKEGKGLKAEELLKLLKAAATECCCKISVVIFSCHSGSFIDELMKDEHVISVYASCRSNELSFSDNEWENNQTMTEHGDWMDLFDKDLEKVDPAVGNFDALQKASESAKEGVPVGYVGAQHPVGWRRGQLPVLAHVEKVIRDRSGAIIRLELHFYEPEFVRCTTRTVNVQGVSLPGGLEWCKWLTFTGLFGRREDSIRIRDSVTVVSAPQESVLAHVLGRKGDTLLVHIIGPNKMLCQRRKMKIDPAKLDPQVKPCRYVKESVEILDPNPGGTIRTDDPVESVREVFHCLLHILNKRMGGREIVLTVHVISPPSHPAYCNRNPGYTITVPRTPEWEARVRNLRSCDHIWIDEVHNPDGTLEYENFRQIARQEGGAPRRYSFDAGCSAFNAPASSVSPGIPVMPEVSVRNYGMDTIRFCPVVCRIDSQGSPVYLDSQQLSGALAPGATGSAVFRQWLPDGSGNQYQVTFRSLLPGDTNPANDTISRTVSVSGDTVNLAPQLSAATVHPDSGDTTTQFVFEVTYTDADGDTPVTAQLMIMPPMGQPMQFELSKVSGEPRTGILYRGTGQLVHPGVYHYGFAFDDGHGHQVMTEQMPGPLVTPPR